MCDERATSDDISEVPPASPDFRAAFAAATAALPPEEMADGEVDVAKLQEPLAEDAHDSAERFGRS